MTARPTDEPFGTPPAPLPRLMVAPNGARLGKADHAALPITVEEVVRTAIACRDAGADALHAHVRDDDGAHTLDPGRYRALLDALADAAPGFPVQITTEAIGRHSPAEQRDVVEALVPRAVSVALREMDADEDRLAVRDFYHRARRAGIAVQHILYTPDDVVRLGARIAEATVPGGTVQCLFVLGGHAAGEMATVADLAPFLDARDTALAGVELDWALCAFGPRESDCLLAGHRAGGKLRVGFENNRVNADGRIARDNAERVAEMVGLLRDG